MSTLTLSRSPLLGAAPILTLCHGVFTDQSIFLDTHGNMISRENLNSGSHENYAKHETG